MDEFIAFVVYCKNRLFILKVNSWEIGNKQAIPQFFTMLQKIPMFTHFGKHAVLGIRDMIRSFGPVNIVDHGQLAPLLNMSYDFNALAQAHFGENFCKRTWSSPKESSYSDLTKQHLFMKYRLLHDFAVPLLGSNIWKSAADSTAEVFFSKKGKKKFFRPK